MGLSWLDHKYPLLQGLRTGWLAGWSQALQHTACIIIVILVDTG